MLRWLCAAGLLAGCDHVFGLNDPHGRPVDADLSDTPAQCFAEHFDDGVIDPAAWDLLDPAQTVRIEEVGGTLELRIPVLVEAYNGVVSKKVFDLVDGSAEIKVEPGHLGGYVETGFVVEASSLAKLTISAGAGNLNLRSDINSIPVLMYIPYTADMAYWRIRHQSSSGMMFLETSAGTERFAIAMPYMPSTAKALLYGGSYQGGPPDVEAVLRWDDLVVYTARCPRP